nr:alpha/beta hydrolase [uncultured Roseateles sp.]
MHGYLDGPPVWQRLLARLDQLCGVCVQLAPVADSQRGSAGLLEAYAQQVLAACARASATAPVILVGHSMGGAIVELAAAKGFAGLAGLVLITPAPLRGVQLQEEITQRFVARAGLTDRDEIRAGKRALAVSLDAAAQGILADATLKTGEGFALEQLAAWTGGHPQGEAPSRVRVPVQIITTDDRFFTAELLQGEARRFSSVEVCHIAGAGHWPQLEQADSLANAMNCFFGRIVSPLSSRRSALRSPAL